MISFHDTSITFLIILYKNKDKLSKINYTNSSRNASGFGGFSSSSSSSGGGFSNGGFSGGGGGFGGGGASGGW